MESGTRDTTKGSAVITFNIFVFGSGDVAELNNSAYVSITTCTHIQCEKQYKIIHFLQF